MKTTPAVPPGGGIDGHFLTTLVEINREIISTLDLDLLLKKIAELTQRILHIAGGTESVGICFAFSIVKCCIEV